MYLIQIGIRYYSARRSYNGGLTTRSDATRFTLADATQRASQIHGATVTQGESHD